MKKDGNKFVGDDFENGVTVTKFNWSLTIPSIDLCVQYEQNPYQIAF